MSARLAPRAAALLSILAGQPALAETLAGDQRAVSWERVDERGLRAYHAGALLAAAGLGVATVGVARQESLTLPLIGGLMLAPSFPMMAIGSRRSLVALRSMGAGSPQGLVLGGWVLWGVGMGFADVFVPTLVYFGHIEEEEIFRYILPLQGGAYAMTGFQQALNARARAELGFSPSPWRFSLAPAAAADGDLTLVAGISRAW